MQRYYICDRDTRSLSSASLGHVQNVVTSVCTIIRYQWIHIKKPQLFGLSESEVGAAVGGASSSLCCTARSQCVKTRQQGEASANVEVASADRRIWASLGQHTFVDARLTQP